MTDADEDDVVEIVYGYARADPEDPSSVEPRTTTVPAARHEAVAKADDVFQSVSDEWIWRPGVRSVGLSPGGADEPVDAASVVVSVDPSEAGGTEAAVRDRFPDSVDGVPIEVEFVDASEGYPL